MTCPDCNDTGRWQFGDTEHSRFLANVMPCPRGCLEPGPFGPGDPEAATSVKYRLDGPEPCDHPWDAVHYVGPEKHKIICARCREPLAEFPNTLVIED